MELGMTKRKYKKFKVNGVAELTVAVIQNFKHASSDAIMCERDVIVAEMHALEVSATRLQSQLKEIRQRQRVNAATFAGMNLCIERRG